MTKISKISRIRIWRKPGFEAHAWKKVDNSWPQHSHAEFKLEISINGSGSFTYRNSCHTISTGEVMILQAGEPCSCGATGEWLLFYIDPAMLAGHHGIDEVTEFHIPVVNDLRLNRLWRRVRFALEQHAAGLQALPARKREARGG